MATAPERTGHHERLSVGSLSEPAEPRSAYTQCGGTLRATDQRRLPIRARPLLTCEPLAVVQSRMPATASFGGRQRERRTILTPRSPPKSIAIHTELP
jgi:hypothetical protein